MSGSLHNRLPRTLGPSYGPKHHFRLHESGGICLNIPVHSSHPGQLSRITASGGVSLNSGATTTGNDDPFLKKNTDGSVSIRVS